MQEQFEWRRGRTMVYKCFYHLVLTPKYRRDVFTQAMLEGLEPLMKETCEQMGGELLEFGAEEDHSIGEPRIRLMEAGQGRAKPERSDALTRWNQAYARGWLMARQFWVINHAKLRLPSCLVST